MSNHTRHNKRFTPPAKSSGRFTTPPTSMLDAVRRARSVGGPHPVLDPRIPLISMVDDDELVLGSWGLTELPDVFACILNCTATGDDVTVRHPRTGGHLALHQESVFALYLIVESILQIDKDATDARGRA